MKIFIASDHAGFKLKAFLIEKLRNEYDLIDLGTNSDSESVDYNDYAELLVKRILEEKNLGVLICNTGIGMSIAANRYEFIRAALCCDLNAAKLSKQHNNANVLVLASTNNFRTSEEIFKEFFSTDFSFEERHTRRVNKLSKS